MKKSPRFSIPRLRTWCRSVLGFDGSGESAAGSSPPGWIIVAAGVGIIAGVGAALLTAAPSPAVPQPIAFNHLKHTQDLKLGCTFCHKYVKTGAHAGLPDEQTCSMCHLNIQGTSEEAARVTELLTAGQPIRFNKLFRLPPHVFYTHGRHVGIAELECVNCHGGIADSERPPERALVKVDMDFCIDCHIERGQSLDCISCHR